MAGGLAACALVFYCNGKKIEEHNAEPELSLAKYLREKLRLTGTKISCGQGGCGACTVMLSAYCHVTRQVRHVAVNSCLVPLCAVHGMAVTTVEGLGSVDTQMHPVQERIAKFHGSQCGFCTPGMVMSMYTLLRNNPKPSQLQVEAVLAGNLCRCTGYRPILQAFGTFTDDFQCPMGDNCCKNTQDGKAYQAVTLGKVKTDMMPYNPSQELIFPSELQLNKALVTETACFHGERVIWVSPTSLSDLQAVLSRVNNFRLLAGNTSLGLGSWFYPSTTSDQKATLVSLNRIPELCQYHIENNSVSFGSMLSLNDVNEKLCQILREQPEYTTRGIKALSSMISRFAGNQIRSVVTLGGNLASASPTSDINTVLCALGAVAEIQHADGTKTKMYLNQEYFKGFRKTALKDKDVITQISIPFNKKSEYIFSFKQGRKRDNDSAFVNACFKVELDSTQTISSITIVYGGVTGFTFLAKNTADNLINRKWSDDILDFVTRSLVEEIQIPNGAPGGKEEYRRALIPSLFHKFYLAVQMQLNQQNAEAFVDLYPRAPCHGSQVITEVPEGQDPQDSVGQPVQHVSANKQATGEARYVDDIPHFENELHMSLVLSKKAHAKITNIDASKALSMPGFVAFFCHKDVNPSHFVQDDPNNPADKIFAQLEVTSDGQVVGAVVATSLTVAQRAAQAIKVQYEDLPSIITIQDAIDAKSYFGPERRMESGEVSATMKTADRVLEGQVYFSGQEQFYMETQGCVVVPHGEDGELEIFSSTHYASYLQMEVAKMLGVQANKILVRVKRVGGAFGGKELKPLLPAYPASLAAHKLKQPVRCILPRSDDMVATGSRHNYRADYKVGCTKEGKITAVEYQFYNNGGHTLDCSAALMELTMLCSDNGYKFENMSIKGQALRTHTPSNTACRGAGSTQGVFFAENLVHHVAQELGLDPVKVREMNLHEEGDVTHFGQVLENVTIKRCWEEVLSTAKVAERQDFITIFNKENCWKKRGLAVTPMKYGIGFPYIYLNQGGALVQVYLDGSVLLLIGGVEVGQGLYTKMVQVAGRALGISTDLVHISETSTNTVPNAITTSASINSDIYGMAVLSACEKLTERLKPYREKNPGGKWVDWVSAAYSDRVNLSATGFHKVPGLSDIDWSTGKGNLYPYFSFGAACSEVEIDCLTGAHTVIRSDLVMDVGQSLNPAIDVGQIEGGFVMGMGLVTCEERLFSPEGRLVTTGPYNYKIPGCTDIPQQFYVSLLKGASNAKAIYSSKGIGEPPLYLAMSVFFAIKEAISAARISNGLPAGHFRLDCPATSEAIRMACGDSIAKQSKQLSKGSEASQTYIRI